MMSSDAIHQTFAETDGLKSLDLTTDDRKPKSGSLPFKKRKLLHSYIENFQPTISTLKTNDLPLQKKDNAPALTLLAAASGAFHQVTPAKPMGLLTAFPHAGEATERLCSTPTVSITMGPASSYAGGKVGPSPVTPVSVETPTIALPLSSSSSSARPRVHHPPLSSPLPGGCHGRTSRNNSFCRRTPCFNGSHYCKLHYQQYVVAGNRAPVHPGTSSETSSGTNTPISTVHQDKRFTGCGGETRCAATTTRGRPCAYISVDDTKYCHLHSDYATNPPPRRGGSTSITPCSSSINGLPESRLDILPKLQGCPTIPDLGGGMRSSKSMKPSLPRNSYEGSRFSPTSDESISLQSTNANPSWNHALLSSISSDQWLNRRVMIGTGPLARQKGTVLKWGNGWVTVQVHENLTHNRRSIELYLLPDASCGDEEMSMQYQLTDSLPHCVSYETCSKHVDPQSVPTHASRTKSQNQVNESGQLPHSVSFDMDPKQDLNQLPDTAEEVSTKLPRINDFGKSFLGQRISTKP